MDTPAIGKQLLRIVSLVMLLALAFAPTRAPYAQALTFNTTTVLTSSPNPSHSHEAITFMATVTAEAGAPPVTGMVFFDSPTIDGGLGQAVLDANGQASFTMPFGLDIPLDYVIHVVYGGTSDLNPSETSIVHTVIAPPTPTPTATPISFATTTVLTSSPNPSRSHEAITFMATVTAEAGAPPVTGMVFFDSPTIDGGLGQAVLDANGQASFTMPFGLDIPLDYVIHVVYGGTSDLNPSETSIVHTVIAPPTPTPTATSTPIPTSPPTATATSTPSFTLGCPGPTDVDNGNVLRELIEGVGGADSNGQDDTISLQAGCVYDVSGPGDTLDILADGGSFLTIEGNGAAISGGGSVLVFWVQDGASLTLNNVVIRDGMGGVLNDAGTLTVTNSTFSGNSASVGGGIANADGTVIVTNTSFTGNTALDTFGGGIANQNGSLTVTNSTFIGNYARNGFGGGIANYAGMLNVTNSIFESNSADHDGGGIVSDFLSTSTITGSTFTDNRASTTISLGGGIFNGGAMTIINSTLSGNNAVNSGGGIFNDGGTITITNTTIVGNSAPAGGGGIANAGTVYLGNSILFDHSVGDDCIGIPVVHVAPNVGCTGDFTGDPLLGTLTGSPAYYPLLPGSAAIDAGDNSLCPATDQRGALRPMDGDGDGTATCDLGTFEADTVFATNTPVPTFTPTATNTATPTPTSTNTATATATFTVTSTPSSTRTPTRTPSPTRTPTPMPVNRAPSLTVYLPEALVLPGGFAANLGDYSDPDGDSVTLRASAGNITKSGSSVGLWLWDYNIPRGTPRGTRITVTLTATDARGAVTTRSFVVRVR